ncbi:DSK2B [Symbiodinium microadriaticum]|nr:DSK2B [Symbiodinium microadriaticum]
MCPWCDRSLLPPGALHGSVVQTTTKTVVSVPRPSAPTGLVGPNLEVPLNKGVERLTPQEVHQLLVSGLCAPFEQGAGVGEEILRGKAGHLPLPVLHAPWPAAGCQVCELVSRAGAVLAAGASVSGRSLLSSWALTFVPSAKSGLHQMFRTSSKTHSRACLAASHESVLQS